MAQRIPSQGRFEDKTKTFVDGWRDVAERFCSACWHGPVAGHNAAVDMKLGPEHFADPTLWTLARVLSACAATKAEPKLSLVTDAMHDLGEPITAPTLAVIQWRGSTSAGLANYAALLVDFARRRELHDRVRRLQSDVLDVLEPVGDTAQRIVDELTDWQNGTAFPEPPKLSRPPVIVMRPIMARTPGRMKRRKSRRCDGVRVKQ